jgi:hypothetical protein
MLALGPTLGLLALEGMVLVGESGHPLKRAVTSLTLSELQNGIVQLSTCYGFLVIAVPSPRKANRFIRSKELFLSPLPELAAALIGEQVVVLVVTALQVDEGVTVRDEENV